MRCKLVHLDASLVQWFRNVRRRRHKTETKGGQKGINPTREREERGAKVSFGYLRAESQSGSVQILSGDKDNALDYETSHGPGIYLFAKFIYELVRLHRNNRADTSPSPCPCPCPARITQVQTETGALSQTWSCVLCCSSSWTGIVRYQVRQEISD